MTVLTGVGGSWSVGPRTVAGCSPAQLISSQHGFAAAVSSTSDVHLALLCSPDTHHLRAVSRPAAAADVVDTQGPVGPAVSCAGSRRADRRHPQPFAARLRPRRVGGPSGCPGARCRAAGACGHRRAATARRRCGGGGGRGCDQTACAEQETDGLGSSSQEHDAAQGEHEWHSAARTSGRR